MIIKTDKDSIESYRTDASNYSGSVDCVYVPENAEDLAAIAAECSAMKRPITVSGAGTGLAGARVPHEGAVIACETMKKVIDVDFGRRTITVEPGVGLGEIQSLLAESGYFYPPDPTEINASIGGNVATNASGARTFKYGATRKSVRRLRLVLADGEILDIPRGKFLADGKQIELVTGSGNHYKIKIPRITMPKAKHSAGYYSAPDMDAIDLFIGSEGTLAITAEIELDFLALPEHILGGIVFFESRENAINFIVSARNVSKENNKILYTECRDIAARLIEYFDIHSLNLQRKKFSNIPPQANAAVWFEQECAKSFEDDVIDRWYKLIQQHSTIPDETWFAADHHHHKFFKEFRHALPLAINDIISQSWQQKISTDIAVPEEFLVEYFNFTAEVLAKSGLEHTVFGHISSSHLHTNIFAETEEKMLKAKGAYDFFVNFSLERGGTVAGEHGIGKIKKHYLTQMFGKSGIEQMKNVKRILDPHYLLGRATLFD